MRLLIIGGTRFLGRHHHLLLTRRYRTHFHHHLLPNNRFHRGFLMEKNLLFQVMDIEYRFLHLRGHCRWVYKFLLQFLHHHHRQHYLNWRLKM